MDRTDSFSFRRQTIEDLEDSLVLLKQALKESDRSGMPLNGEAGAVPLPTITMSGSIEKHGKRSKKTKAKSMIEIPGGGMRSELIRLEYVRRIDGS